MGRTYGSIAVVRISCNAQSADGCVCALGVTVMDAELVGQSVERLPVHDMGRVARGVVHTIPPDARVVLTCLGVKIRHVGRES